MDSRTVALTVVNIILLLSPIVFFIVLVICLIVVTAKFLQMVRIKKKESVPVKTIEKQTFVRKFMFIVMAFPMAFLSSIAQSAFTALVLTPEETVGYLTSLNIVFIFSFACTLYISFLMLYISFLLLSTLKQINRITTFEYACWCLLIITSLVIYSICCVMSAIISSLSVTASDLKSFSKSDRNVIKIFVLIINYVTFWACYWICALVLVIGIRFYLLIISYSKKVANQMIIFLSILIIAGLIQSFAALLPSFSSLTNLFIIFPVWLQRVIEFCFMVAFMLMYIPLQSVQGMRKIAKEVIATVEKLGNLNKQEGATKLEETDSAVVSPSEESVSTTGVFLTPQL